jgi:hypothetical protein
LGPLKRGMFFWDFVSDKLRRGHGQARQEEEKGRIHGGRLHVRHGGGRYFVCRPGIRDWLAGRLIHLTDGRL